MLVKELFKGIPHRLVALKPESEVRGITADSRTVAAGDLFVAVKGNDTDGHFFIADAIAKGAAAVCAKRQVKGNSAAGFIIARNTYRLLPLLSSRFYGEPSRHLKVIGVTGTNGKTTVTHILYAIFGSAKKKAGLIGTICHRVGGRVISSSNTTPGPVMLQSLLSRMKEEAAEYAVMEVSSHALKQGRVAGVGFKYSVLTNITGDHLDYHKNMRDYAASKRILFESIEKNAYAVLNADDSYFRSFRKVVRGRTISYGISRPADFSASGVQQDINGCCFVMNTPSGRLDVRTRLIGRHNIYNILAAAAVVLSEGLEPGVVCAAIERFEKVAGRMEPLDFGLRSKVFIDYAHTHDALKNVLSSLKGVYDGRIVLVFGCGGNRDKTKRPAMGRIACRMADYVVLTNDNPRDEDPDKILAQIEKGFDTGFANYKKIPDRYDAIREAVGLCLDGGIVLIAGKGHEDYQIVKGRKFAFNDKEAALRIISPYVQR